MSSIQEISGLTVTVKASDAMDKLMDFYSGVSKEMAQAVLKVTNKTVAEETEEIRAASPKRTGAYRDGWTYKKAVYKKSVKDIAATVYNKDRPMLTQLLEYNHPAGKDYHLVKGKPHIKPAEKKYNEIYLQRIEDILGGIF